MTSCSQNSLGVGWWLGIEQERMCQLGPHTYPHQYSQRETQRWKRNLMSGRCTKKGAGISSQLVTASGNNTKISLDKWE